MKNLNIIDEIIQEPLGGAHRDYGKSLDLLGDSIELKLNELLKLDSQELKIIKQKKLTWFILKLMREGMLHMMKFLF